MLATSIIEYFSVLPDIIKLIEKKKYNKLKNTSTNVNWITVSSAGLKSKRFIIGFSMIKHEVRKTAEIISIRIKPLKM